jgi:Peptidase_C39 like family/Carboxypeptidase regulatory-like domain
MAAESGRVSVAGTVTDGSGTSNKPAANVEVQLLFGSKSDTRRTGADGKYQFGDLLPGKYTVKVVPPGGLKTKGDSSVGLTLDGGDVGRADFILVAMVTPTVGVAQTAKPSPSTGAVASKPSTTGSQNTSTTNQQTSSSLIPSLIAPLASPSTVQQPNNQTVVAEGRPQTTASPAPLEFSAPPLVAPVTGTPQPKPTGTPDTTDVLAAGPPRRLITSFEALREVGGGGSAAQLKSWATDSSLVLGVPFRTQIDGTTYSLVNCGPASLAMVLTAFGVDVDPASVRDYLNFLIGNYDPVAGTSLYVLSRIAREAGLNAFGMSGGNLQGWSVEAVREQVRAGHPVITLTKYRRLPGHFGSVTEFDHYIVITGLAGEDFVYNDAAYATEYGYNLLITPQQLERAWADSSMPRHAVAIGMGDGIKPLPIVPRSLTAESLAAPREMMAAPTEAPARAIRGPAAERLREQMLDELGARTAVLDGIAAVLDTRVPPTRLDATEVPTADVSAQAVQDDPSVRRLTPDADVAEAIAVDAAATAEADTADSTADLVAVVPPADVALVEAVPVPVAVEHDVPPSSSPPVGLALLVAGVALTVGAGVSLWARRSIRLEPRRVQMRSQSRQTPQRRRRHPGYTYHPRH